MQHLDRELLGGDHAEVSDTDGIGYGSQGLVGRLIVEIQGPALGLVTFGIDLLEAREGILKDEKTAVRFFPSLDDDLIAILPLGSGALEHVDELLGGDAIVLDTGMHADDDRCAGVGLGCQTQRLFLVLERTGDET